MNTLFDLNEFNNPIVPIKHPTKVVLMGAWSEHEMKVIEKYFPDIERAEFESAGVCHIKRSSDVEIPSGRYLERGGSYVFSVPSLCGDTSRMAYESFAWALQACRNIFVRGFSDIDKTLTQEEMTSSMISGEPFAFDIETTGLSPFDGEIISAAYCRVSDHRCFCVYGTEATKSVIKTVGSAANLIVCNAIFEIKWCLVHTGVRINVIDDVQILAALLNEEGHKGLEYVSAWVGDAGYDYLMTEHLYPLNGNGARADAERTHASAPKDMLLDYNARDAVVTAKAWVTMSRMAKREYEQAGANFKLVHGCMLDTQYTLAQMEIDGMYVDPVEMVGVKAEMAADMRDSEKAIKDAALIGCKGNTMLEGGVIRANIKSTADKLMLLHLCGVKAENTAKNTLSKYKNKPAAKEMIRYSGLSALTSGLMTYVSEAAAKDGFIRSNFSATSLVTGQLTSRNPPMLNVAKTNVRRMFTSRFGSDGVILSLDYSQLHLRIMANISGCGEFIDAFLTGRDPHSMTGSAVVMGIDEGEFLKRLKAGDKAVYDARQVGKRVNFSVITEVTAHGLSTLLSSTVSAADRILRKFYEVYPEIKAKQDAQHDFAAKHGYVVSPSGRIRHLRAATHSIPSVREKAMRQATDYSISNPGRFTTLLAMNAMREKIEHSDMESRIVNQLHDAIIHDVKLDELPTILKWAKECYIELPQLVMPSIFKPVGLAMEGNYANSWNYGPDSEFVKL